MIYPLSSILIPIKLEHLFPVSQPLEVELGSGDGSFLVEYARQHPERNFIGIERLLGRIRKLDRKGRRVGLTNLRGVRIESMYFLRFLLPRGSASAIHIYFPDPWPKRRHAQNRLISPGFPELAAGSLSNGGTVYLRTDDEVYFSQMQEVFGQSPLFETASTPLELMAVWTDFEQDFRARGIQTRYAAYQFTQDAG